MPDDLIPACPLCGFMLKATDVECEGLCEACYQATEKLRRK